MANKNTALGAAKINKKDEFYTQLSDIEKELKHYRQHFKDKIVLCNCDDPFESNFFKYFVLNFNRLGLKKLIATSYATSPIAGTQFSYQIDDNGQMSFTFGGNKNNEPLKKAYKAIVNTVYDKTGNDAIEMLDIAELFESGENELIELLGDGDFRSGECIELLKEADIVVTNPPFSLFREYVAQLMEYDKKFIIIGNQNAIHYKEIFPLLMKNEMWIGYGFSGNVGFFESPYKDTAVSSQHKEGMIRVSGIMWYTNLDIKKHHEELILVKRYDPDKYPKYDNYDAIEVGKTTNIPCDYSGLMGVPDTFMDKYTPEQFEILGCTQRGCHEGIPELRQYNDYWEMRQDGTKTGSSGNKTNGNPNLLRNDGKHNYFINNEGRIIQSAYNRIFIRNRHPENPEEG